MKHIYITFLLSILVNTKAFTQTTVSGIISKDAVWDISGSPYNITNNVNINQGVTVTIKPGVEVFSSNNTKIIINGELIAEGNSDSFIQFKSVETNFTKLSKDYDPSTGKGNRFAYCVFTNPTSKITAYQLYLEKSSINLTHCKFQDIYYGIYGGSSDSTKIWISNSTFTNTKNTAGFPIYLYNIGSFLSIDNCKFSNYGYIYAAETNIIKNSFFRPFNNYAVFYFTFYTKNIEISCNLIRKATTAFDLTGSVSKDFKVNIQNNEFDSCTTVFRLTCSGNYDSLKVSNNNFKRFTNNNIEITSCGSTSGKYKELNFRDNYWISGDSNDILNTIVDFRQNAKIAYKVDIDGFRSAPVGQCWPLVQGQIGISPQDNFHSNFSIYPNPAKNTIQIKQVNPTNASSKIFIMDALGKVLDLLVAPITSNEYSIDIISLKPGIYFICLLEGEQRHYLKFIKK
jgi:hypothetical protein